MDPPNDDTSKACALIGRTELGDEEGGALPARAVAITDAELSADLMSAGSRLGWAGPSEAR